MLVTEQGNTGAKVLDSCTRYCIQRHLGVIVQLWVVFKELVLVTGESNAGHVAFEGCHQLVWDFVELQESLVDL